MQHRCNQTACAWRSEACPCLEGIQHIVLDAQATKSFFSRGGLWAAPAPSKPDDAVLWCWQFAVGDVRLRHRKNHLWSIPRPHRREPGHPLQLSPTSWDQTLAVPSSGGVNCTAENLCAWHGPPPRILALLCCLKLPRADVACNDPSSDSALLQRLPATPRMVTCERLASRNPVLLAAALSSGHPGADSAEDQQSNPFEARNLLFGESENSACIEGSMLKANHFRMIFIFLCPPRPRRRGKRKSSSKARVEER